MSKFQLARKYSTEKIVARAFKEYTESVAENYSNMMSSLADVINIDINSSETREIADINAEISIQVQNVLNDNGITDDDCIVLSDGVYNVKDLYTSIAQANYINDMESDVPDETQLKITKKDGSSSDLYTTVEDLLTDVNSTYHATICTAGVAQAYALGDNISDQVQLARDYVGQKFSSAYSDVSGYLEDSINSIKNGASVTEWITGLLRTSGIDDAAEFENFTFQNSESYLYTGASPAGALCWNTFKDKAVSTVKVAAIAVKTIVGGIINIGKKLFSKVKDKVVQVVTNPYDLEEINKRSYGHTIDGYADQKSFNYDFRELELPFGVMLAGSEHLKSYEANKFIHTDYFCCETMTCFKINDKHDGGFIFPSVNNAPINILSNCKKFYSLTHQNAINVNSLSIYELIGDYHGTNIKEKLVSAILSMTPSFGSEFDFQMYKLCCERIPNNSYYLSILNKDYSVSSDCKYSILDLSIILLNAAYIRTKGSVPQAISIIRYKPINYKSFGSYMKNIPCDKDFPSYDFNTNDIIQAFNHIVDTGDMYADCSDDELTLYNSFVLGFKMTKLLLSLLNAEIDADLNGTNLPTKIKYAEYYVYKEGAGNNIQYFHNYTNTPFEEMPVTIDFTDRNELQYCDIIPIYASGINITNKNFFYVAIGTGLGLPYQPSIDYWDSFNGAYDRVYQNFNIFTKLNNYKNNNPTDYEFWPYEKKNSCWNDPQFRIKSDSDNINYLNNFVVGAVVVVAAVVIGITAKKLIRRKLNKAYIKQQASQANAVQAARDGVLTNAELKQYAKSTKKLNKLNKLFGNTTTVSNSTTSNIIGDISSTIQSNDSPARDRDILNNENSILNNVRDIAQEVSSSSNGINDLRDQILLSREQIHKLIVGN